MPTKDLKQKLLALTGACAIYFAIFNSPDGRKLLEDSTKELEFVHITHTGGAAVEHAAAIAGFNWGTCHYIPTAFGCTTPDKRLDGKLYNDHKDHGFFRNIWHVTPKDLDETLLRSDENPYTGKDLFTVVRNPYERIMSEYYCPWFGYNGKGDINNQETLNHWVKHKLQAYNEERADFTEKRKTARLNDVTVPPLFNEKHLVPQYDYVYDNAGKRIIQNVIHFEDMQKEFKILMSQYGLSSSVKLDPALDSEKRNGSLTRLNLQPDTVAMINTFYLGDFEAFGYNMVEQWDHITPYKNTAAALPCKMFKIGDTECDRDVPHVQEALPPKEVYEGPIGVAHSTTFLLGIFSDLSDKGAQYRKLARDTYLSLNDPRLCSFEEYKRQKTELMLPECRVPYVFVVGANPDREHFHNDNEVIAIERSLVPGAPEDESDIVFLNISENNMYGKSATFFKWATENGADLQVDFAAKVAHDTLLDITLLIDFIELDLPAAPYNRRTVRIILVYPCLFYYPQFERFSNNVCSTLTIVRWRNMGLLLGGWLLRYFSILLHVSRRRSICCN